MDLQELEDQEPHSKEQELDEFREEDCSDDEEQRRRRRRRGQAEQRPVVIGDTFLPNSSKKLRACVFCKLVLNQEKWNRLGTCPNCPDSRGTADTTDCFESFISLIFPKKSWVADWQKMVHCIPGLYALAIRVPQNYQN